MRTALTLVSKELGPDAAILSSGAVAGGVEIVAAIDYDEALLAARRQKNDAQPTSQHHPGALDNASEQEAEREKTKSLDERASTKPLVSPDSAMDRLAEQSPWQNKTDSPSRQRTRSVSSGTSAKETQWLEDPSLARLRESLTEEMQALRHLLETQMADFGWQRRAKQTPVYCEMMRRLVNLGLPVSLANHFASQVHSEEIGDAWYKVAALAAKAISITDKDLVQQQGVYALVGPTGVGKTTTLAKLAARGVLQFGPDAVALITTDGFRIGAHEQLQIYAQLLGVECFITQDAAELNQILERLLDKKLVLIDTAGVAHRDERLLEQAAILGDTVYPVRIWLTLSATAHQFSLTEAVKRFSVFSPTEVILTKLDEATSFGPVLSQVIREQLTIAYVTDGQKVPEDIRIPKAHELVAEAIRLANAHPLEEAEEWRIAQAVGGLKLRA
ncbi:MAG: flagellar biosynthesis protein FlhF [Gammaproteobacteria bacterium]|nr:MAG: flagellar biosynthesis protein FlhF [Gammaproteobacteria bacterium]